MYTWSLQAREMSQAEVDQQKRRALKAQKARQAAIESLRLKREERKQEVKRIAEQEIVICYSCVELCPTILHVYLQYSWEYLRDKNFEIFVNF